MPSSLRTPVFYQILTADTIRKMYNDLTADTAKMQHIAQVIHKNNGTALKRGVNIWQM